MEHRVAGLERLDGNERDDLPDLREMRGLERGGREAIDGPAQWIGRAGLGDLDERHDQRAGPVRRGRKHARGHDFPDRSVTEVVGHSFLSLG